MERSTTERISPKSAISLVLQDLKSYNELNTVLKALHKTQQDLEALNIVVEQRHQAIAILVDLKSRGISDTELVELNNLINSWGGGCSQKRAPTNIDAGNNGFGSNAQVMLRLDDKLNLASHR